MSLKKILCIVLECSVKKKHKISVIAIEVILKGCTTQTLTSSIILSYCELSVQTIWLFYAFSILILIVRPTVTFTFQFWINFWDKAK